MSIFNDGFFEEGVGDVVKGKAFLREGRCRFVKGRVNEPVINIVDRKLFLKSLGIMPDVMQGKIEQNVVGRGRGLQQGLAPSRVAIEILEIIPPGIGGAKMNRRVKKPPRPGSVRW